MGLEMGPRQARSQETSGNRWCSGPGSNQSGTGWVREDGRRAGLGKGRRRRHGTGPRGGAPWATNRGQWVELEQAPAGTHRHMHRVDTECGSPSSRHSPNAEGRANTASAAGAAPTRAPASGNNVYRVSKCLPTRHSVVYKRGTVTLRPQETSHKPHAGQSAKKKVRPP